MATYLVTNAELLGFYSYGWAAEGFSALATGVFFPIVLEELRRLQDYDCITLLEVIEHLDPDVLKKLPETVFKCYRRLQTVCNI